MKLNIWQIVRTFNRPLHPKRGWSSTGCSILFFADPSRTHFVRKAHAPVRICRLEIGERLAQQDILQAESVQILTKGEIPVIRFGYLSLDQQILLW